MSDTEWPSGHRAAIVEALRQSLIERDSDAEGGIETLMEAGVEAWLRERISDVRPAIEQEVGAEAAFNARLQARWSSALDQYDLFMVITADCLRWIFADVRPGFSQAEDQKFEALLRLVSRAYMTAQEVRVLLRHGYSSGALARWRTIDELRVISSLLAYEDEELSRRYLMHHEIEQMRDEHAFELLNRDELGPAEDHDADRNTRRRELVDDFGPEFLKDYGWSAPLFPGVKGYRFNMIRNYVIKREAEDRIDTRAVYRVASHGTHANSRGIMFNIQSLNGDDYVWSGPSNSGLAGPAVSSTASLYSIFAYFISYPLSVFLDEVTEHDDLAIPAELLLMRKGISLLHNEVASAFSDVSDEQVAQEDQVVDFATPVVEALREGEQTIENLLGRVPDPEQLVGLLGHAVQRGWIEETRTYRLIE